MATTVESPPPSASLNKGCRSSISSLNPSIFSHSSERRFWRALRSRFDALTENSNPTDLSLPAQMKTEAMEQARRLKQDSKLLLRGFDLTAHSLSQLSNNLETALQGARDLTRPPTFTELLDATIGKAKLEDNRVQQKGQDNDQLDRRKGLKRKLDSRTSTEGGSSHNAQVPYELGKLKKAKNLAMSMATNVATMARELKSVRSELECTNKKCALLEEENGRLRNGLAKGILPGDDEDLVRLQLEALLGEKSRLVNENANLMRENQRLHQLLEYHLLTLQDYSFTYETEDGCHNSSALKTPCMLGFSESLDE